MRHSFIHHRHYSKPQIPDFCLPYIPSRDAKDPAVFQGRVLHSHSYRKRADFADQTVLILGAGASGQDIALEIANVANKVFVSEP